MSVAYDRYPEWEPQDDRRRAPQRPEQKATVVDFPLRRRLPERDAARAQQPGGSVTATVAHEVPAAEPHGSVAALLAEPALPLPDLPDAAPPARTVITTPAPLVRPWRPAPRPVRGPLPCPASVPAPADPGTSPLRLTRRGRRLLAAVAAAGAIAMVVLSAWVLTSALTRPVVPDSAPSVVVVHSGESLWTIAHDIAPASDPRKVVAALQERNHLATPVVHPGQSLQVPR